MALPARYALSLALPRTIIRVKKTEEIIDKRGFCGYSYLLLQDAAKLCKERGHLRLNVCRMQCEEKLDV